jgi:hypothetical protein
VQEQKVLRAVDLPAGDEGVMDVVQLNESQIATCSPSKLIMVPLLTQLSTHAYYHTTRDSNM